MQRVKPKLKENSRKLRSQLTDAEQMLWQRLRMRQILGKKFRRQHPCGGYILDFACVELKIAIELDGGQHSTTIDYDSKRSAWLSTQGWLVLRFWNKEMLENIDGVLQMIEQACRNRLPPPQPSPLNGEGEL